MHNYALDPGIARSVPASSINILGPEQNGQYCADNISNTFSERIVVYFDWNFPEKNCSYGPSRQYLNIDLGNDWVLSGTKRSLEPVPTKIIVAIWSH